MPEEKIALELACPCGGKAMVTSDPVTDEPASLIHTLPMCEQYEKLEPDEYLRWVRGRIEGTFDA